MTTKTILMLCLILSFPACHNYYNQKSISKNKNFYHQYSGELNSHNQSSFSPKTRKIEFGYFDIIPDSTVKVLLTFTTGINEGKMKGNMRYVLNNGIEFPLTIQDVNANSYLENNPYTTCTPVTSTSTISVPAVTETIKQKDGTKLTVTKPATTKTVETTENETTRHNSYSDVILNKGKVYLNPDQINSIKKYGIRRIEVDLEDTVLEIYPKKSQNRQFRKYL